MSPACSEAVRDASFGISRIVTRGNGDFSPHQPSNRSSSHPVPRVQRTLRNGPVPMASRPLLMLSDVGLRASALPQSMCTSGITASRPG